MQQKASSNSERQYAILGPNKEWISWEVEQLTIFVRRNLQGIPTKKNVRLEIHQDGCQQKYFISQSLQSYGSYFIFLPSYLELQAPATYKFGMCLHFWHAFSGNQLFCDTLPSEPKTTSLSQDATKGFVQWEEKERTEVVSRSLVAMYLLQSDLQLWRAGSNDHGYSFSSGIGKEWVSHAWIRGQPFLQHPEYDHPLKKTMCAKQYIFGTFKSKQLFLQSWYGCSADQ